jgi:hypothetical protein
MALTLPKWLTPWANGGTADEPSGAKLNTGYPTFGHPKPTATEHNWLFNYAMNGVQYLARRGIPEWSSSYTYVAGSVVRDTFIYEATGTPVVGTAPAADPANWRPWLPNGFGPFGTGADGNATISGGVTLSGDQNYSNLAIGASGVLRIKGGVLRVKGTLTIASGGVIRAGVASEMAGGVGGGGIAGAAGVGGNAVSAGTIFAGASGGAGGATLSSDGDAGVNVIDSRGGNAGAGGAGAVTAGGAAGTRVNTLDFDYTTSPQQIALAGGYGFARGGSGSARTPTAFGIQGGPGGGGGGGGSAGGGGGGAGGGVLLVLARRIVIADDGALSAPGGAGGNGTETGGAGGGGGGGVVLLVYGSKSGPTLTAANCCPGGAGGTGGANPGAAGTQGYIAEMGLG